MSSIVLSLNKKIAMVDEIQLKVSDVIDYVDTITGKVCSGVIDKFWLVDPKDMKSIWAKIRNLQGDGCDDISLKLWKNHLDNGTIRN